MTPPPKKTDYRSSGVDIDASNVAISRIAGMARETFGPAVLTDIGSFGAMVDLKELTRGYRHPVLVQSIDGVGTKMIVARMMNRYDTLGIDLVSATCNDIVVLGAKPLILMDYIASDRLDPDVVEAIVTGMAQACRDAGVSLVGGETAEMPGTYRPGEHDLVGVITGVVEKNLVLGGQNIQPGDALLGLASSGLHTNGYSLARKIFFERGRFDVNSHCPGLTSTVGETLLEPHLNYTRPVLALVDAGLPLKGMAHITGGGLLENIPRILPPGCGAEIHTENWSRPAVFDVMRKLGNVDLREMFRTFNMGIGLVIIAPAEGIRKITRVIEQFRTFQVHEIGGVVEGNGEIKLL
ncbi:MAG: phosphoribosylformylglycinamidine cyclo-ligase [Fidelibacterota bacterium]